MSQRLDNDKQAQSLQGLPAHQLPSLSEISPAPPGHPRRMGCARTESALRSSPLCPCTGSLCCPNQILQLRQGSGQLQLHTQTQGSAASQAGKAVPWTHVVDAQHTTSGLLPALHPGEQAASAVSTTRRTVIGHGGHQLGPGAATRWWHFDCNRHTCKRDIAHHCSGSWQPCPCPRHTLCQLV